MCFLYSTAKCISMPCAKPVPCRTFRSVQNVRGDTWSARPAPDPTCHDQTTRARRMIIASTATTRLSDQENMRHVLRINSVNRSGNNAMSYLNPGTFSKQGLLKGPFGSPRRARGPCGRGQVSARRSVSADEPADRHPE